MKVPAAYSWIVLGALACPLHASANSQSPPSHEGSIGNTADAEDFDPHDASRNWQRAEIALFDDLRNDPSPRQQVLAGRIYIDSVDETPSALRPTGDDVVARAVSLAPDDAFVQWVAASEGSYTSSSCGPTTWPEAEVANLVRLEPDNAAAWQFAVALAAAIGDQNGVDDALSRMASATRADDHSVEEREEWKKAYASNPDLLAASNYWRDQAPQHAHADLAAFQRMQFGYNPADSSVKTACTADAGERTWQRLGWCADAARILAERGGSVGLRKQGLELLTAIGDRSDAVVALQKQHDWLDAHDANPLGTIGDGAQTLEDALGDWRGAKTEIEAIERRLQRTGQPLAAPNDWTKVSQDEAFDTQADAATGAYFDYLRALFASMASDADLRIRVLAINVKAALATVVEDADAASPSSTSSSTSLAELAAGNPDDLIVQWIAASSTDASAIANVQRLDSDNALAWAFSLRADGVDAESGNATLQRMAASRHYSTHTAEMLALWVAAIERQPVPPALTDARIAQGQSGKFSGDLVGKGMAIAMTTMSMGGNMSIVTRACTAPAEAGSARATTCASIGRLMLHSNETLLTAMLGASLLRVQDAMDDRDRERARQIAWLHQLSLPMQEDSAAAFVEDFIATGSEIEALRRVAERLGKGQPPSDWNAPGEKRAGK